MGADAHQPDDDAWFFHADIGYTYDLAIDPGGAQLTDAQGPLVPGRYVVQLRTTDDADYEAAKAHFK